MSTSDSDRLARLEDQFRHQRALWLKEQQLVPGQALDVVEDPEGSGQWRLTDAEADGLCWSIENDYAAGWCEKVNARIDQEALPEPIKAIAKSIMAGKIEAAAQQACRETKGLSVAASSADEAAQALEGQFTALLADIEGDIWDALSGVVAALQAGTLGVGLGAAALLPAVVESLISYTNAAITALTSSGVEAIRAAASRPNSIGEAIARAFQSLRGPLDRAIAASQRLGIVQKPAGRLDPLEEETWKDIERARELYAQARRMLRAIKAELQAAEGEIGTTGSAAERAYTRWMDALKGNAPTLRQAGNTLREAFGPVERAAANVYTLGERASSELITKVADEMLPAFHNLENEYNLLAQLYGQYLNMPTPDSLVLRQSVHYWEDLFTNYMSGLAIAVLPEVQRIASSAVASAGPNGTAELIVQSAQPEVAALLLEKTNAFLGSLPFSGLSIAELPTGLPITTPTVGELGEAREGAGGGGGSRSAWLLAGLLDDARGLLRASSQLDGLAEQIAEDFGQLSRVMADIRSIREQWYIGLGRRKELEDYAKELWDEGLPPIEDEAHKAGVPEDTLQSWEDECWKHIVDKTWDWMATDPFNSRDEAYNAVEKLVDDMLHDGDGEVDGLEKRIKDWAGQGEEGQPAPAVTVDFDYAVTQIAESTWRATFQDLSEPSEGDSIQSWSWDFGDGASSDEQHPTHEYTEEGTYTVTLKVATEQGAEGEASKDVTVEMSEEYKPHVEADFTYSVTQKTENIWEVDFEDHSRPGEGDAVSSWSWDFGDGTSSDEQNPTHEYHEAGTYTVALVVATEKGAEGTVTKDVQLESSIVPPPEEQPPTEGYVITETDVEDVVSKYHDEWQVGLDEREDELNKYDLWDEAERLWNITVRELYKYVGETYESREKAIKALESLARGLVDSGLGILDGLIEKAQGS